MSDLAFIREVSSFRSLNRQELISERSRLMFAIASDDDCEERRMYRLHLALVMSCLKHSGGNPNRWLVDLALPHPTSSDHVRTRQGDILWKIIDSYDQHKLLPNEPAQCQQLVKKVKLSFRLAAWFEVAHRARQAHPHRSLSDIICATIRTLPDDWKPQKRAPKVDHDKCKKSRRRPPHSHPYSRSSSTRAQSLQVIEVSASDRQVPSSTQTHPIDHLVALADQSITDPMFTWDEQWKSNSSSRLPTELSPCFSSSSTSFDETFDVSQFLV